MTLYGANGQINTTSVSGSSYTGLLAADGSYNIVINDGTALKGLHHPCGAFNAVITTNSAAGFYAPNGSMNVIANSSSPSGYSPVQPVGTPSGFPLSGAVIDESFTNAQYFPRSITSEITISPGTSAIRMMPDATGKLVSIAANALPITTAGFQPEGSGNNDIVNSQYPTGWGTSTNGGSITTAATAAPDGTNTGVLFTAGTSTGAFSANPANFTTSVGNNRISFFYIKPGTARFFAMRCPFSGTNWCWSVFDAQNLTFNNGFVNSTGYDLLPSGWMRYWVNHQVGTSLSDKPVLFMLDSNTLPAITAFNPANITGTGQTFYFWAAQSGAVVDGFPISKPVAYMPTTGAAVTRGADNATIQRTGLGTLVATYSNIVQPAPSSLSENIYPSTSQNYVIPANLNGKIITRLTGYSTQGFLRQSVSTTAYPMTTAAAAQAMMTQHVFARARMDTIQFTFALCTGIAETLIGGTTTIKAQLNYNGTLTPITFSGIATGSSTGAKYIQSDEVPIPSVPVGQSAELRIYVTNSNNTIPGLINWAGAVSGTNDGFQYGATVSDVTNATSAVPITTTGVGMGASAIASRSTTRAAGLYGDSIQYGEGKDTGSGGGVFAPNSGLMTPALSTLIPVMNLGSPSDSLVTFVTSSGDFRRLLGQTYCTSFGSQAGRNDLNTRTAPQIITDSDTFESQMSSFGPMVWSTITPRASSTDNYATTTNQTTDGSNAARLTVNTYRRTKPRVIDYAPVLEYDFAGANSGIWRTLGAVDFSAIGGPYTQSGLPWQDVHPTAAAYIQCQAVVPPALFT